MTTPEVGADLFASADNAAICSLSFVVAFAAGANTAAALIYTDVTAPHRVCGMARLRGYSTVTDLARLRG